MFIQSFIYRKRNFLLLFLISVTSFSQQIGDGVATHITDFSLPLSSGLYQGVRPIGATPDLSHDWQHLFVLRHTNPSNNHQLQIGASYNTNDRLFFRKIATGLQSSNPDWIEVATRGGNTFVGNQSFSGDIAIGKDAQISTISGPANSGAIQIKTNSSFGGPQNRYLRLGWKDNNSVFYPAISVNDDLNVGIGTITPSAKLNIEGDHGSSRFLLHANGNGQAAPYQADLSLWASEPGLTWSGVGIGNNIHNYKTGSGGLTLLNTARGGSYIRLLDNAMQFNVVANTGTDLQALSINSNGNVGIGTTNPTSKLTVAGNINSREVKVSVDAGADFVFEKDYALPSLQEVEKFVTENKHLPEIASAKEMQKEGINLSEMNIKLLQKIEELTLYVIEMKKENTIQSKEIEKLKEEKESYKIISDRLTEIEKKLR
jgi:hypothetical protein